MTTVTLKRKVIASKHKPSLRFLCLNGQMCTLPCLLASEPLSPMSRSGSPLFTFEIGLPLWVVLGLSPGTLPSRKSWTLSTFKSTINTHSPGPRGPLCWGPTLGFLEHARACRFLPKQLFRLWLASLHLHIVLRSHGLGSCLHSKPAQTLPGDPGPVFLSLLLIQLCLSSTLPHSHPNLRASQSPPQGQHPQHSAYTASCSSSPPPAGPVCLGC